MIIKFVLALFSAPWPVGDYVGAEFIGTGWWTKPLVGWERLETVDALCRFPHLAGQVWLKLGPIDLNFRRPLG